MTVMEKAQNSLKKDWPADLHLIGKDIIRFHTIYWPIFLMALDLPLPKQVFGHPWLLQGDGKMSKSKGNVLYADELVDFFGVDAVRYFVLHEMPFENDGVITWELMVERLNSDLANTLGNLVNRTVSMTNKYFGGVVSDKGAAEDVDADLKAVIDNTPKAVDAKMDGLRVADAITEIFNLFKRCNKYIDETMPWALAKDEEKKDRLETVLWNLIQGISAGARLLESFMPSTSKKILDQLGDGHVTEKPEILFQRLDLEEVMKKVEELHPHIEEAEEEEDVIDIEAKPEITFDDFGKMQFQVGKIIACEEVKKIQKTPLLTGEDWKPGKTDRIRNQRSLHSRRNGRKESDGSCKPETGKTGRSIIRRNVVMRRRCRRKSRIDDTGENNAGRSRDLLRK